MVDANSQRLADRLDVLANAITEHAGTVIGNAVIVNADASTTGTVIGEYVSVNAGQGSHGTLIGKKVVVDLTEDPRAAALSVADQIRETASSVRAGSSVPVPRIKALIDLSKKLGNAVLTAGACGAVEAIVKSLGS